MHSLIAMGIVQSRKRARVNIRKTSTQTRTAECQPDAATDNEKSNKENSKTDIKLQITTAGDPIKEDNRITEEKTPSPETSRIFWRRFSKSSSSKEQVDNNSSSQTTPKTSSVSSPSRGERENSYTVSSKDDDTDDKSFDLGENLSDDFLRITDPSFTFAEDELVTIHQVYNYINDGSLRPNLCDPTYLLILDTREISEYDKSHIITARHSEVVYSGFFSLSAFNYGFLGTQTNLTEFAIIIVYGDKIDLNNINMESSELKLFKELKSYDVEPSILVEGYDAFYAMYPFLCNDIVQIPDVQRPLIKTYPSAILPNQLYQGRGSQATDEQVVKDLQITHVVNISNEHKNAFTDFIKYLSINVEDVSSTKILEKFPQATNFISKALKEGGKVMVHCHLGVSRSSTITIAYLMKSKQWSLKKAHAFLRDHRTCIRPNLGFLKQLSQWEESILGKKVTDVDELWY